VPPRGASPETPLAAAPPAQPRTLNPIVIRFGRLGDMVMLTALLQLLHQRFGGPCEVFAAGPWNAPLYESHPDVGRLWVLGRHTPTALGVTWWRAWWQLWHSDERPVYVCEHQPRQVRRIRRLLTLAGVKPARCLFITLEPGDPQAHWVERLGRLGARTPPALHAAGYPSALPDVPAPRLYVPDAEVTGLQDWLVTQGWAARELILVQPGNFRTMSAHREEWRDRDDKAWSLESWVALLCRLDAARPNAMILLCGAPQEGQLLETIATAAGRSHVAVAALPLRRFLALCRVAHSMISIDTGPAHAAAALGVPLVVMYGAECPQQWLPRSPSGSPVHAVGGPPRSQRVADIAVDEVFECWQAMLASRGTGVT
jgi:ADP-heptose:LPS heptosyltransferase